jgi:AbrB family transcriptional regulator (stage V sporulation protein T)
MDKILRDRRSYLANSAEGDEIVSVVDSTIEGISSQIIVPIITNGDCIGAVVILSRAENEKMDLNLLNLARLTAEILSNHFE